MRLSENGPTYTVTISAKELAVMSGRGISAPAGPIALVFERPAELIDVRHRGPTVDPFVLVALADIAEQYARERLKL